MSFDIIDKRALGPSIADAQAFVRSSLALSRNDGLISRNASWKDAYGLPYGMKLWSPRWQLGAGFALRVNLVAGNLDYCRKAFTVLMEGAKAVKDTGEVPCLVPPQAGAPAGTVEIAQSAAFWLAEASIAYLALKDYPLSVVSSFATDKDLSTLKMAITRAAAWLYDRRTILLTADAQAPNRLLFDAVAFFAANKVSTTNYQVTDFVNSALACYKNGIFQEKGGSDTNYQAVALNRATELLMIGYDNTSLNSAVLAGSRWYLSRIDVDGVIHSAGNTRTCWNGEEVLGVPKQMSPIEVWRALSFSGAMYDAQDLKDAATRVASWIKTEPTNTCIL